MKYVILCFAFFIYAYSFGQYDDVSYPFKKNTIRIGFGTQSTDHFPVKYISNGEFESSSDFEIEYERQLNRFFSASILYKNVNYDLRLYLYKEHQKQINFFYVPFTNFRRFQFKIGGGLSHSTINEINNFGYEVPSLSFTRTSRFEYGIIGIAELNYTLCKNISFGLKGFQQFSHKKKTPYGGLAKLGYSV